MMTASDTIKRPIQRSRSGFVVEFSIQCKVRERLNVTKGSDKSYNPYKKDKQMKPNVVSTLAMNSRNAAS